MKKKIMHVFLLAALGVGIANAAPTHKKHPPKSKLHTSSHKKHKKSKKVVPPRNYMYGLASYYGGHDGFEGRRMANGDIFHSQNVNVCAHPTLPLGTKLRVTNLTNGRSIYVEVTDRMPRRSRVIDLSKSGAETLGMHGRGIARVQLLKITDSEFEDNKNNVEVDDGDSGAPD